MMVKVEDFIKSTAPGGLYGEWAKKEDCWLLVKTNKFQFDLSSIENEFVNKNSKSNRVIVSNDEIALEQINEEIEKIRAVPFTVWKKIDTWAIGSKDLSPNQINIIDSIAYRVRTKTKLLENERLIGIKIIDIVIDKAPELLFDIDDIIESEKEKLNDDPEIDYELIRKMITYDRTKRKLKDVQFMFLRNIVEKEQELSDYKIKLCLSCFHTLNKHGFKP